MSIHMANAWWLKCMVTLSSYNNVQHAHSYFEYDSAPTSKVMVVSQHGGRQPGAYKNHRGDADM